MTMIGHRAISALLLVAALAAAMCAPASAAGRGLSQAPDGPAMQAGGPLQLAGLQLETAADICPAIMGSSKETACTLITTMRQWVAAQQAPTCVPNGQIPLAGTPAPLTALPKPVASEVSYAELAPAEGATYAWMWRMLRNFANWWPCWTGIEQFTFPAGYRAIGGDVAGSPGAFGRDGKPFMLAASDGAHVVVAIRSAASPQEVGWENEVILIPDSPFAPVTLGGRTRSGLTYIAQKLWRGLQPAIDAEVLAPGSAVTRVTFTGHSLGAAVGTILSAVAAEYIATTAAAAPRAIAVEGMFFGSPSVGDAQFADWVAARVNLRSLAFKNDLVASLPCASMPVCDFMPPTSAGAVVGHAPTHGRATIPAAAMPTEVDVWESTNRLFPLDKYPLKRQAAHNCAYTCALAKYGGYASDECHIALADPEPGHTACPSGLVV